MPYDNDLMSIIHFRWGFSRINPGFLIRPLNTIEARAVKVFLDVRLNPWKMGYPLFVRGCSLINLLHLAVHLNKQTNKQTNKTKYSLSLIQAGSKNNIDTTGRIWFIAWGSKRYFLNIRRARYWYGYGKWKKNLWNSI